MPVPRISRRRFLVHSALASAGGAALLGRAPPLPAAPPGPAAAAPAARKPRRSPPEVAAIITEYRPWSHADVIVGRLIQGYALDTAPLWSPVRVRAMYIDQFPAGDLSRALSHQYRIPITKTVREAILDDAGKLAVDGVVLIGEHGDYPHNERGQHLYPRRRFFEETVAAFREAGEVAPVFNDKHLSARWEDGLWMRRTAREMGIPFLAGSSLPLAWRRPWLELPLGARVEEAVAIAYGGIESYGFHGLETLQCMVERRAGGETGVRSVQCLEGEAVWRAMREGRFSRELALEALRRHEPPAGGGAAGGDIDLEARCRQPAAFLIEYRDGLRGALLMLDGLASRFLFAARLEGCARPLSTELWLQEPEFGHFSYLANAIAEMVLRGEAPYPAERTLLTTGILSAAMDSRFEGHRRIETEALDVTYAPADHDLGAYRHPQAARQRGWIDLVDGRSLDAWLVPAGAGAPRWEAREGTLLGSGGRGALTSLETFADFELFAELRTRGAGGDARPAVELRFRTGAGAASGETADGHAVRCDAGGEREGPGSIVRLDAPGARAARRRRGDGSWRTLRLHAEGDRLRTQVDGEPAADCTDAGSRFRRGSIAIVLADPSASVEVREIRVRRS